MKHDQVRVIIPYADDGQDVRRSSFYWCIRQWERRYELPVNVATADLPWRKGEAVNRAVRTLPSAVRVIVIADADVFLRPVDIAGFANLLDWTYANNGWATPTARVVRLTGPGSAAVKNAGDLWGDWSPAPAAIEEEHRQHAGGGLTIIHRDMYQQCPLDPRFEGWGHEDDAWAYALHTMVGAPLRGSANLYHLWHEPQARQSRLHGSEENRALFRRYHDARGDRDVTRAIIDEWRVGQ